MMTRLTGIVLLFSVFMLTGCNTIEGMGKDLEKAGQAVQKSTK
ncbi:MAG TPA: entericidin A/B family lipoprotein [Methylophilaceae bacterium]|jgi:entericidin B